MLYFAYQLMRLADTRQALRRSEITAPHLQSVVMLTGVSAPSRNVSNDPVMTLTGSISPINTES